MIKFFRKIRQSLLSENKFGKYLMYAIGEIVLVVIGILIALQINNWNESQKEQLVEKQLINLLISDLEEKKVENASDLAAAQRTAKRVQATIDIWETQKQIDTTNLKGHLNILAGDNYFQNQNSPIYSGLSNSNLWKQIPDSLTKQIDDIFRIRLMTVSQTFDKASEYGTHCKLNFLVPNNLMDLSQNTRDIQKRVSIVDEEFISYSKLFINTVGLLSERLEQSAIGIEKLIANLETYAMDSNKKSTK